MGLRLADHWLWDFWLAEDGDDVHAFFLQAPRSLGDPELRHVNATVGHAVSRDLRTWEVLPDPLGLGAPGAFDDRATWTGCVVRDDTGWRMYYTGVSTADETLHQRVGAARSADLRTWEREGVLCESDPRWYERDDWRDPWVYAADGQLHMLVCARVDAGPADERGVVGHATSADGGATWSVQPPVSAPGELRQIEVPQLLERDGAFTVLGCAGVVDHSAARLARGAAAQWGMFTLSGPTATGPFTLDDQPWLLASAAGTHYAGRAIERDGRLWLLSWLMHDADGAFVGELADPVELAVGPGGALSVA